MSTPVSTPLVGTESAAPGMPLRFVTAASLFDGHDASINIVRRMLQASGVEVVHLGHDRSVAEVVDAAIQEGADGIAVSSYQGGHVEYFGYMIDMLAERGASQVRVFGGGGGVIVPAEVERLHARGVARIYTPGDGQAMGLQGMVDHMIDTAKAARRGRVPLARIDRLPPPFAPAAAMRPVAEGAIADGTSTDGAGTDRSVADGTTFGRDTHASLSRLLGAIEDGTLPEAELESLRRRAGALGRDGTGRRVPVLGITGTGGSGKSSLTDELIRRLRIDQRDRVSVALLAIDPSRRRSGGALLGDRIRMNALGHERLFMRSIATRGALGEVPPVLEAMVAACRLAGVDLVIVETPGIGQGDSGVTDIGDVSLYVMTPEFGAASQLEKIDMLDFADVVAINKFERRGGEDALRDVRKQVQRNRGAFAERPEDMPVYGTVAARFDDDGVTALYQALVSRLRDAGLVLREGTLPAVDVTASTCRTTLVPPSRQRYLAEIAETVRAYHREGEEQARLARERQQLLAVRALLSSVLSPSTSAPPPSAEPSAAAAADGSATSEAERAGIDALLAERESRLSPASRRLLDEWPAILERYAGEELVEKVGGRELRTALARRTLSGTRVPRVALPRFADHGELLAWRRGENLPGYFPYTAGVFPFRREGEEPTRMFAGEGDAARTNRRFHALSEHAPAKRLSTAFDSVTLYGRDPSERPDVRGKIGNAGVSIATVEDMQTLYDGFDLCAPSTSVSMTINGPAPTVLAFYLLTALRQRTARFEREEGRAPDADELDALRADTWRNVRGTVQADILKEDQGQNTCIFSTEFGLRMMGDIQAWFIEHEVRRFYSVSISGYHIAEAGANPITQLALTLSNGFTYVETYLARGMAIDDFAPSLSFFFSNGMDPEYTVIGRVARRIWAVAMRERYGASERSARLKYHVQTSGRSLHAQEMAFNDIRTTLQALMAINDNCNSLHTNAYDEAVTTPTDESVRRAMAIQLIINREWGQSKTENPAQGSFLVRELTDLVEEAVLAEFERLSERGGVLGAMETGYQRGKIQDESMRYEQAKHDGSLPIVGVNCFVGAPGERHDEIELARSSEAEKRGQIERLAAFHERHAQAAPGALERVRHAALTGKNVFAALLEAAEVCSLGQLTDALFEVGGQYRRNL